MGCSAHLTRAALTLSCLLATPLEAQATAIETVQATSTMPLPDGYAHERRKIADGVWALVQPEFLTRPAGNVTVIEQKDGFVLIDAGGSPGAARRIVEHVRAIGSKPIKAVVITHWHGDHPLGLDEILKAFPKARTISTAATQRYLGLPEKMTGTPGAPDAERNAAILKRIDQAIATAAESAAKAETEIEKAGFRQAERVYRAFRHDIDGAITIAPKEGFEQRLLLDDPVRPVELLFLGRANTDGDAIAWLPKQRVVVTGDIVVAPIPFGFGSYPRDWLEVLKKISAMDFAVLVPGHGEPQRDRAYLNKLIPLLQDITTQVSALAAQGLSLDDVRAKLDLSTHAKAFAGDDPWLSRWFQRYWVTPIATSGYKEAKGEPWDQLRVND